MQGLSRTVRNWKTATNIKKNKFLFLNEFLDLTSNPLRFDDAILDVPNT